MKLKEERGLFWRGEFMERNKGKLAPFWWLLVLAWSSLVLQRLGGSLSFIIVV